MRMITDIKVGQEVYIARTGSWETHYSLKTIAHITPTGRITVSSGQKFNAEGIEMGVDRLRACYLLTDIEEIRKIIKTRECQRMFYSHMQNLVDMKDIGSQMSKSRALFALAKVNERLAVIQQIVDKME